MVSAKLMFITAIGILLLKPMATAVKDQKVYARIGETVELECFKPGDYPDPVYPKGFDCWWPNIIEDNLTSPSIRVSKDLNKLVVSSFNRSAERSFACLDRDSSKVIKTFDLKQKR